MEHTLRASSLKGLLAASFMLAAFLVPSAAFAEDLHTLTSVDYGGITIHDGDTVTRSQLTNVSQFWNINFSWPEFVPFTGRAFIGVFKGTFGDVEGAAPVFATNFAYQKTAFAAGSQFYGGNFALPALGDLNTPSGTYTVMIIEYPFNNYGDADAINWFAQGGLNGSREPYRWTSITFNYVAQDNPQQIQNAIDNVQVAGRTIHQSDQVFRKELAPLNGSTDNYWIFNFNWPTQVQNQQAELMVFRGTYGNVEGGAPVSGTNYFAQFQAWAAGNNEFGKFMYLPALKDASTTAGTYTVMIAERDPKYLSSDPALQAQWFASGGTLGLAPIKYSLMTFEFKGDDHYPVIIVPGILGSSIRHGQWVLDPVLHTYDNLVDTFIANGYVDGKDLFKFPYDWHKSNVDTALLLRDKINAAQVICHCQKVDLVAHSMGGLVSRQYIQSSNYENDVDHMVFLGTPHLGAPKDYLMWEAGDTGSDLSLSAMILKSVLSLEAIENGYSNLFSYIHAAPISSVKELLPVYSYLFDDHQQLKVYPAGYPENPFLLSLKSSVNKLFDSGVSVFNYAADDEESDTVSSIDVKNSTLLPFWPDGMPTGLLQPLLPLGINFGSGDQTVPLVSATSISAQSILLKSKHNGIPTDAEGLVYSTLTGKAPSVLIKKPLTQRVLMFRIFSPADLTITSPDGKKIGRIGSGEVNEIPGAFYSGFDTDTEYVVIPDPIDGQYTVSAQGNGAGGSYKIATNYISPAGDTEKEVTGMIAPNQIVDLSATLTAASPDPMTVHGSDIDAPVITIASPTLKDYLHSDLVPIQVSVADVGSGVASTSNYWDGLKLSTTTRDLFYDSLGTHTFSVSAVDGAGNATTSRVVLNVITSTESTILDINKTFDIGWILKKNVRDTLLDKMNKAIKIEKKIITLTEQLPGKPKTVKKIEKFEARLDKVLGVNVVKELDNQLGKGITQAGYDVIKADIQWLLNQP